LVVSQPAAPTSLRYEIQNSINVGECVPFRLVAGNSAKEYSPVTSAQVLTYSFSNTPIGASGIYTDSDCLTAAPSTVQIFAGTTKSPFYYFRWDTSGSLELRGSGTDIPFQFSNVTVNPL
jgi:hypothetical protein